MQSKEGGVLQKEQFRGQHIGPGERGKISKMTTER